MWITGKRYDTIIVKLQSKYESILEYGSNRTYDEYYYSFIKPFEEYYNSRMSVGEDAQKAYLGISDILTYGGNSAGDCSLLWKYVYYQNFYCELCDLEEIIY